MMISSGEVHNMLSQVSAKPRQFTTSFSRFSITYPLKSLSLWCNNRIKGMVVVDTMGWPYAVLVEKK